MASATNGVPYPSHVHDSESLNVWISSIDRESETASHPSWIQYREILKYAYFDDADSQAQAEDLVCRQMAMTLFSHLLKAPKSKIVWRIKPEFDVSQDTIPSDLSLSMSRKQIDAALPHLPKSLVSLDEAKRMLGKEDWASDFCTDSIFPVAAPKGHWRIFKSYMRYAVLLGNEVIPHPIELR